MSIELHHGNCFELLETLPDNSIDLLLTDPPYATTACKWDEAIDLQRWWQIVKRKLKPKGLVVCFAGGRFSYELYASNPGWYRYDLIWEKSSAVGYLDSKRRPLRAHELILVFSKEFGGTTYNPQKTLCDTAEIGRKQKQGIPSSVYSKHLAKPVWVDDGYRYPRSVLRFDSIYNGSPEKSKHPTQKPSELVEWLIKTYSNEGDLVVDTFAGSGTTAVAAYNLERSFWGCELDANYYAIGANRIKQEQRVSGGIF